LFDEPIPPGEQQCLSVTALCRSPGVAGVAVYAGISADAKPDCFPVIWDTGASLSISHEAGDFVSEVRPPPTPLVLKGLAKGLNIVGVGTVEWLVSSQDGTPRLLCLDAYLVPSAGQRLLCPQSYIQQQQRLLPSDPGKFVVDCDGMSLVGAGGNTVHVPFQTSNNLPLCLAWLPSGSPSLVAELNLCVTDAQNQNLSLAQKELLRWHYRLGHLHFESIRRLLRTGALSQSAKVRALHRSAANCDLPKCASCQFGKAKRRPSPGKAQTIVPAHDGSIKKEHLSPGQQVSVDHFICSAKGRLYSSKGKTTDDRMFSGGCLFVDHASSLVHVEHQVSLTSHETLQAKHRFETMTRDLGVTPQSYLSDNSTAFTNSEFTAELRIFRQVQRFAGVGAHHHNGVAERNIQTIMAMARTMMLHAAIRWPEVADPSLWPMAVDYAVYLHNHLPTVSTGLAPIDVFTGSKWPMHKCNDLHVWGSPTYVLDPTLQDGKKLPRWKPRSRRAVFVGFSPKHATTIPLVVNLVSGAISPQFHCVFDDWFSTVFSDPDRIPDFEQSPWTNLFSESRFQYPFDANDGAPPPLEEQWHDEFAERTASAARELIVRDAQDAALSGANAAPPLSLEPVPSGPSSAGLPISQPPEPLSAPLPTVPRVRFSPDIVAPPAQRELDPAPLAVPLVPASEPPSPQQREQSPAPPIVRRSSRSTLGKSSERFADLEWHLAQTDVSWYPSTFHPEFSTAALILEDDLGLIPDRSDADSYFSAFVASRSDPDTLTFDEAMRDADCDGFRTAMGVEITSLEREGTWTEVPKQEALDKAERILPGTWAFKRKRHPEGYVTRLKARYCVRGDLQPAVPDTFAPVVMWSTVRLLMVFTLMFELETRCIDFSNAFVQAKLDQPIYIHTPRGFRSGGGPDTCLRLNKSLYGISQAPRLWFEHLKAHLLKRGFSQSRLDPCLFYSATVTLVVYVDDVICASKDSAAIQTVLTSLKSEFTLTEEGELATFLGISVDRNRNDKSFTLTQTGLIDRIIAATGMTDCRGNRTPATQKPLVKDLDGEPMDETWNYRSVVGMLLYLSNNSRPDVAFAVHQCARFSHAPRKSHATAVKTIIRYLSATRDKGMVMRPTGNLKIDCYCDADFAGLWGREEPTDASCAKSRTGFIIMIGGVPLLWGSKLQTTIALSTMEAETNALCHSMRELLPIREIVKEMAYSMGFKPEFDAVTYSTVFEDNNGTLGLANMPRITPRSKHFAVKLYFFRHHVASGEIRIVRVDTDKQLADTFTKSLSPDQFEALRLSIQGW
jgi:hypothetical protein